MLCQLSYPSVFLFELVHRDGFEPPTPDRSRLDFSKVGCVMPVLYH